MDCDELRCRCGRAIPEGVCWACDLVDGVGLDARGGYGGEPEDTRATANALERAYRAQGRRRGSSLRALQARRREREEEPASRFKRAA